MNETLHSICNRGAGFQSAIFPDSTAFIPERSPSTAAQTIRELARLGPGNKDYYAVAALSAINQFPDILSAFAERGRNYFLEKYRRPAFTFENCTLIPSTRTGQAKVARLAEEFPVNFEIVITCASDNRSAAVVSYANTEETVSTRYSNERLIFDWPEACGVTGILEVGETWNLGHKAIITHVPVNFPYAAAVKTMRFRTEMQTLLRNADLRGVLNQSVLPCEQYALLMLALGKSNTAVY